MPNAKSKYYFPTKTKKMTKQKFTWHNTIGRFCNVTLDDVFCPECGTKI